MSESERPIDPTVLDEMITAVVRVTEFGPNWREPTEESQANLDETGCDYPRVCKFYGQFPDFCDRSCTEMLE